VRVTRAGFLTAERTVDVPERGDVLARVTLVPTPETRAAYKHRTELRRTLGRAGVIGGSAVAAAAVALLLLNRTPLRNAEDNVDRMNNACETSPLPLQECLNMVAAANDELSKRQHIQLAGFISLGVGVAAAGVGTVLLLTGDDPDRYDRVSHSADGPTLSGWVAPSGGGGLAVVGGF
jgi:hypothetical protein